MNELSSAISAFAVYSQKHSQNLDQSKKNKNKKDKKLKSPNQLNSLTMPTTSVESKQAKIASPVKIKKKNKNKENKTATDGNNHEGDMENSIENNRPKMKKIKKLLKLKKEAVYSQGEASGSEKEFLPKQSGKRRKFTSSAENSIDSEVSRPSKKKKKNLNSSHELEISTQVRSDNGLIVQSENSSVKIGEITFEWLISPITVKNFFTKTWEKGPVHVERSSPEYYKSLLSTKQIDDILRNNNLFFGRNVDITSYTNGKRETFNPEGRALPPIVWDYYSNGCSVRLLNPQTYSKKLQKIITYLQEFFGSFVGANAYLTPPNSQGFAPHYDDIEAFILQIEGTKRWKLYAPRNKNEVLPRYSSPNFTEDDLPNPPILEATLEAGDMLYFPRGTIHQGRCVGDNHSLHITLSFYQKLSWGDYLEKLIPMALEYAIKSDSEFREGLPLHFPDFMGMAHVDDVNVERASFCKKLETLLGKLFKRAPVDSVVDLMSKQFQHTAMPPILTHAEKLVSSYGDGEKMLNGGVVVNRVEIDMDTRIKLLRRHILRLVLEDNVLRIYHYAYNSKEYQGTEPQFFEIDLEMAPGVEMLIKKYPEYVAASDLPIENEASRIQIVSDLWERGLLLTEEPLPVSD